VKLLGEGSSSGSGSGGSGRCLTPEGDGAAAGGDGGTSARALFGPGSWPSSEQGSPEESLEPKPLGTLGDALGEGATPWALGEDGGLGEAGGTAAEEGGASINAATAFSGTASKGAFRAGLPSGTCPYVRGSYGSGSGSGAMLFGLFGAQGSGSSAELSQSSGDYEERGYVAGGGSPGRGGRAEPERQMSTLGLPRAATSREERRQKPMLVVSATQQVVLDHHTPPLTLTLPLALPRLLPYLPPTRWCA
jgi:hypothetical protein